MWYNAGALACWGGIFGKKRIDTMKLVNVGNALKVTCVGFAAGVLLRVVQMLYFFDYDTDFYTDGGVMDTIVHVLAGGLDLVPTVLQAPAMFLICTVFNVFMASGSGQAAVMMPLLLPVADLVGMTRQTVILAFNFGDGFGNYIFPTSTALMGLIGAANIPYDRWMRFIGKIFLLWVLVGCILVAIAQAIHLQ